MISGVEDTYLVGKSEKTRSPEELWSKFAIFRAPLNLSHRDKTQFTFQQLKVLIGFRLAADHQNNFCSI